MEGTKKMPESAPPKPEAAEPDDRYSVKSYVEGNKSVIKLPVNIDIALALEVKQAAIKHAELETDEIVFDFSNTEHLDTATLAALVGAHKRTVFIGRKGLRLCNMHDHNIRKIFEVTGLEKVFVIEDDMDLEKDLGWGPVLEERRRSEEMRAAGHGLGSPTDSKPR